VRKGPNVKVRCVIASEMLKIKVFLFEERSSIRTQSYKAVGYLGSRGVGSTTKAEATGPNLQVRLIQSQLQQRDQEDYS
jgi:hypothetical protein